MSLFQRLAGSIAAFFQVGGPSGPGWNANAGALEGRNAANSAFAVVRGADPVASNDLVTKEYADANYKPHFTFAANASLTTAVAQSIPSGTALVTTSSNLVTGAISPSANTVSTLYVQFTGASGNTGGQTAAIKIQKNGVDVTGLVVTGLATTAGVKTGHVVLGSPIAYAAGDVFTAILTPSSALTTALASVMAGIT